MHIQHHRIRKRVDTAKSNLCLHDMSNCLWGSTLPKRTEKDAFAASVLIKYKSLSDRFENCNNYTYAERSGEAVCQCLKLEKFIVQITKQNPIGFPTDEDVYRAALTVCSGEGIVGIMYTFTWSRTTDVGAEFPVV